MSNVDDAAATMIANLEAKTGRSLAQWVTIARQSGHEKHGQIVKYLKTEHSLTHGYANLISIRARQKGEPASDADLVDKQYAGKESLRPIYAALIEQIEGFGSDVELAPKKAYVSLRRNKQFGLIKPSTKSRVDVGIILGDQEPTDRLERSGSFNSMVSHRVRLTSVGDVDDELIGWLHQAYLQA